MLVGLSIRDIVLIDRLDLEFSGGLAVLTGETGAGKSILLDALGLALGARADSGLVRAGSAGASVVAEFHPHAGHPSEALLEEMGVDREDSLIIRRTLSPDGRSRAFCNDQPVSAGFLKRLGETLVEIQGQFDQHRLMEPGVHLDLLDGFGGLRELADKTARAFDKWRTTEQAVSEARAAQEQARRDEEYLRHALDELEQLDPEEEEEETLAARRMVLMNAEQLAEAVQGAVDAIAGESGAEMSIAAAQRTLDRASEKAGEIIRAALDPLDRAAAELQEALHALTSATADIEAAPGELEQVEDRLHAIRQLARKHQVATTSLPALRSEIAERLSQLDEDGDRIADLARKSDEAREAFVALARELSDARRDTSGKLDKAVAAELPPLKLDKAQFRTAISPLEEGAWGPRGIDHVAFEVSTNPGAPFGSLRKIASGGELSRFLLGLKVVLAEADPVPTLVFDEVDAGVGGAVAAAVGERLAGLGTDLQVLVVTHSPQVASRGASHWHVEKQVTGETTTTRVVSLAPDDRLEEIARMLSGAAITPEARAAARSLLSTAT